jgi:hypothetical protein
MKKLTEANNPKEQNIDATATKNSTILSNADPTLPHIWGVRTSIIKMT